MSNYRYFIRAAAGFDLTTEEGASYTQSGLVWTTDVATTVGRWSPESLGRKNTCSIVRVNLEGTLLGSDTVRVIASNGQTRKEVVASLDSSGWLFLTPEDVLAVDCAGGSQVGILVQDLSEQEMLVWLDAEASGEVPDLPLPQLEIDVTATQAIPAYNGPLIVNFGDAGSQADLTLPSLDATTPGLCSITFIRKGDPSQARIITEDAHDDVNGLIGIVESQYFLRAVGESITYRRVDAGWQRQAGVQVQSDLTTGAGTPYAIPAFREGTLYVADTVAPTGELRLPQLADVAEGCRIVIEAADLTAPGVHTLTAIGGDTINGSATEFLYTCGVVGAQVVIEQAGVTWNVSSNVGEVRTTVDVLAAGAVPTIGGQLRADIVLAADGDVTLPPPGDLPIGSSITLVRAGGVGTPRIIIDTALTTVNGVAGVTATQWYLTSIGKSIRYTTWGRGWTRDQEWAQQGSQVLSAAGAITAFAGELIVEYDGAAAGAVTLPALADVPLGASLYIFRSGLGTPTITVNNVADEVNGVPAAGGNTWRLLNTGESVLYVRVPGGWWRNQPIVFTGISSAGNITANTAREQYYEMTGGAGQTLSLPALSTVEPGTKIFSFNNSGNAHSFVPNGTDKIDGANAALPNASQKHSMIVSFGTTIGWVTITS